MKSLPKRIEGRFDILLIAGMALREERSSKIYRPILGVHEWSARLPGTFRLCALQPAVRQ